MNTPDFSRKEPAPSPPPTPESEPPPSPLVPSHTALHNGEKHFSPQLLRILLSGNMREHNSFFYSVRWLYLMAPRGDRSLPGVRYLPSLLQVSDISHLFVRCQISPISPWGVRSLSSPREVSDLSHLSVRCQISPWGVRYLSSLSEVSDLSHLSMRCQISPIPPWGVRSLPSFR